jgi:hypothetical protein
MSQDSKILKIKNLKIRLTPSEYDFVKNQSEEAYLSLSEYARRRLINEPVPNFNAPTNQIDSKAKFACDHDRELMRLLMRTYVYMKASIKESLSEYQYKACNDMAKEQLKEWGYE